MKAAVFYGTGDIRIENLSKPNIGSSEVLVATRAAGICGTDYNIFAGHSKVDVPRIMGHEFTGEVVEIGLEVSGFKPGDRVVIEPDITCGNCYYCTTSGINNYLCENHPIVGETLDGAFAELVKVPEKILYSLPNTIDFDKGALIEPLACAIHGSDQAKVKTGDHVIILGAGPIGLLLMMVSLLRGAAKIGIIEPNKSRREIAIELGADFALDPRDGDIRKEVLKMFNGRGADVVIVAVGRKNATEQAFTLARPGGMVCIVGLITQATSVNIPDPLKTFYLNEITIVGTNGSPRGDFERSIRLLSAGRIDVEPLITHRLGLDDIGKAFSIIKEGKEPSMKILIFP
jgi:2-desacetyl-2-hydroxyethyl bacteriochlorophyllide A dehydrogenase